MALDAITRCRVGGDRDDYYARVKAGHLALVVKLADIADASDPTRLEKLEPFRRRVATARSPTSPACAVVMTRSSPGPWPASQLGATSSAPRGPAPRRWPARA